MRADSVSTSSMSITLHNFRSVCLCLFLFGATLVCIISIRQNISTATLDRIKHAYSGKDSLSDCVWMFDHYAPSPWESFWYNGIANLQTKVCATLAQPEQLNRSIRSLEKILHFQKTMATDMTFSDEDDALFSKMFYRCESSRLPTERVLVVAQYIEPLIGLIRDPLTICPSSSSFGFLLVQGEDAVQSKRFMLLGPSAPYNRFRSQKNRTIPPWLHQSGAQKILVDLGASLFNGQDHPTIATQTIGARWFYEYFRTLSLQFDRIVAFEYQEYGPKTYWRQIPDDLMGKLTFINVGVEETGKFNPWHVLRTIAKKEDYVIVKLDIDTRPLEMALINQILNTTEISSLIDEMFFEMHITVNEMERFWGRPGGSLKDTYVLFNRLRQMGIRMHSWP